MRCYIFGAGSFFGLIKPPLAGSLIIAADGGLSYLEKEGIRPDIICGDFDSLGKTPFGDNVVRVPVEKDDTDMALAISLGKKKGADEFILYGGTGGRPDHTMANYQTLCHIAKEGCRGYLIGEHYIATAIHNGKIAFPKGKTGTISVFCMGKEAIGVSLKGLKYPLDNAKLFPDVPLGVSNSFTGETAEISVHDGTLLILWEEV